MSRTLECEIVQDQANAEARVLAEAFAAMPDPYQFATDGTTPEPAPTVERRIREALRELRDGIVIEDEGAVDYIAFDQARMSMICDLLDEALELEQTRLAFAATGEPMVPETVQSVEEIVNDLDLTPAKFAIRFLRMEREVQALTERSFLFPRPRGAAQ